VRTALHTDVRSYEEACDAHRWEVPERCNIAADVCDRHPADKPAMVFEDFGGNLRELSWRQSSSSPTDQSTAHALIYCSAT
jgi:hypothetical protein